MNDYDFRQIAPRCGGQREAFEELCCQLARRTLPEEASYTRLWGAGGDGGVECFADLPEGIRIGWQAKYVFDIDSLIAQATSSLTTALSIHGELTRYIVCFPFDLTGPTRRRGRSGKEKFDDWRLDYQGKAAAKGRKLSIEAWPASKLRSLLLDFDNAGGIRAFFFNDTILSKDWFSAHFDSVKVTAGPRYTPELNVETDLWKWFAAFGRTPTWSRELEKKNRLCRQVYKHLDSVVHRAGSDPMSPAWPADAQEIVQLLIAQMPNLLDECSSLNTTDDPQRQSQCIAHIHDLLEALKPIESRLSEDLESQHGAGRADSPGFRQFMAEYMVSFPAANLDFVRDAISAFDDLREWLQSPASSLAFERAFVLTGIAGSGKTHGVCDAAHYRFDNGLLTCVSFGHQYSGEPDPWTRLLESLGLPITLGRDGILDALNAAAEASGSLLILCIDAINETRPLRYWRERLTAFVQAIQHKQFLRLCITCRTSFVPYCLPQGHGIPVIDHQGFAGVERAACGAFFQYYNLKPPITPILQPELSNPLYLRLICETLLARGLDRLPSGWLGLAPAIRAFLDEKERQFAIEYGTTIGADIIGGCLRAIARTIADSGESSLTWSRAQQVVNEVRPRASTLPILEWLVRADLLIDDAPSRTDDPLGDESMVRPAFERLGDFLIARELISRVVPEKIENACEPEGPIHSLVKDLDTITQNSGVLSAISILLPEQKPGLELPNLVKDESVRAVALEITMDSIPWRESTTLSHASGDLINEALQTRGVSWKTMDALLSISWQPSAVDAIWLDGYLKRIPLARRDAFWCGFLHERYESSGPVTRLIDAAFELPLNKVETDVAERWATILLWFTAAADRRVKDTATRAAVAVLVARPETIPRVLTRLLDSDDDEVRERALLSCYGALIISRDVAIVSRITSALHDAFKSDPVAFNNALIRDHIRSIAELASELGVLPDGCDPELTVQPINSRWPLELPSDEEVKRLEELPKLAHSCLHDDFFIYSMGCLRPWDYATSKQDMGKWILQRVAHGFGYEGSGCENYDRYMLGNYGGGRGKKTWAERIGKKYQWVALFQLASRLCDHIDRKQDDWTPAPQRTPMILLEERKLDPTLPSGIIGGERNSDAWWIGDSANPQIGEHLSDSDWVHLQDDLPSLKKILSTQEYDGQRWLLIVSYPAWDDRSEDADWEEPYRQVWIHIESYLVAKNEIDTAYNCIHRRNFFGRWMRQGASWLYGFAGEYPWATPFNLEPDEWHSTGGFGHKLPVTYTPAWNELAVEWEYDASLGQNFHMLIPARVFFSPSDLWWNGRDGYRIENRKSVFRDPSFTEVGPRALISDIDDLLIRLDRLGLRLIWTLIGEKWILGGRHDTPTPRRTFSQIARLEEGGSVEIGDRVFFDDYDKDTGPTKCNGGRA